jgi:FkbM family methyltransferase
MHRSRRILVRFLYAIGAKPAQLAQRLELGPRHAAYRAWIKDRGDFTKRLEYEILPDGVVWDVGGFEGQWASDMVARYGCRLRVFEPVPAFAAIIRDRFARNALVATHEFALGARDCRMELAICGDSSTLVAGPGSSSTTQVEVRDVAAVWSELKVQRVAVMKVNIEGGEYALLERLIETGHITSIDNLQVQFHDFVPKARELRVRLEEALGRTHDRTWCYEFVWENWRRRGALNP